MIQLRLVPGTGLDCGYQSADVVLWQPGEVRAVDEAVARYLTSTFPECFVEHADPPPATRPSSPTRGVTREWPDRLDVQPDVILGATAAELVEELEAGTHDAYLELLEAAERGAKARKTVLAAIARRRG